MESDLIAEIRRNKNRLKKRLSRQRQKENGQMVDKTDKIRRVIDNICKGLKVRSDLQELGITLDMIPCDELHIHPEILQQLKGGTVPIEYTKRARPSDKIVIRIKSKNAISREDIGQVFDQLLVDKKIAKRTHNNYQNDVFRLLNIIGCPEDDIMPCLRQTERVFKVLQEHYSTHIYKNMLSIILSLVKHNTQFKQELSDPVIEQYQQEMIRLRRQVSQLDGDKVDHGSVPPWSEFVQMRSKLCREEPDSIKCLLLSLYTMFPPMRDDFGRIYLVYDKQTVPEEEDNIYLVNEGQLIISRYKTAKFNGAVDIILPQRLQNMINRSIHQFPRQYLITRARSRDLLYDNGEGKLSSMISGYFFNFSINDLRHSFEDYLEDHKRMFMRAEIDIIRKTTGHGANMSELYARHGSDRSEDYTSRTLPEGLTIIESIFYKIGGDL